MSRWFRHYAGMMRDDKLVRVALQVNQPVERVLWIWGAILESAAEVNKNGKFDFDPAEAAYFLRADQADILSVVTALEAMGRLRNGAVAKWGERQFQSDKSAERQRRYRQNHKAKHRDNNIYPSQTSDVTVTAALRNGDAPELETDTESKTEKKVSKSRASRARPRIPIPDDWILTDSDRGYAEGQGFPREQISLMGEAFHNHHRAKGSLMADWHAAWRTWCGNEIKFQRNGNGGHYGGVRGDRSVGRATERNAETGFRFGPKPVLVPAGSDEGDVRLLPERRSG